MKMSEKAMRFQEELIPTLAEGAFKQAFLQALASGSSVLECKNGVLFEVQPDGTEIVLEKLTPPTKFRKGQVLVIP